MADELEQTPAEPEKKEDRRKRDPDLQAVQRIFWEFDDLSPSMREATLEFLKARYNPL